MKNSRWAAALLSFPMFAVAAWSTGATAATPPTIRFDDVSATAGVELSGERYGASWGDLDGDGYPDLFVSNHRTQPSLFLNTGRGTFIDVARQTFSWVNKPNADTHGGTWFDFNNDGHQDLFVAVGRGNPQQFLVNDGRGALINGTEEMGLATTEWGGRLPVWFDYNGDGLPDFILAQYAGNPPIMRQLSTGGFTQENTSTKLVCRPYQYAQLMDVTGDGRLDVICPDDTGFPYRIYDAVAVPFKLLTNPMPEIPAVPDSVIGDFDNDGRMDVFMLSNTETRPSGAELSADGLRVEARLMGSTKGFNFVSGGRVTFGLYQEGFSLGKVYIGAQGFHPSGTTFTLDPGNAAVAGMPPDDPTVTPIMRIGYDPGTHRWTVIQRSKTADGESVWSETYFLVSSTATISDLQTTGLWQTDKPGRPTLLMNRPEGFVDETVNAGLGDPLQCSSVAAGDYNNDAYLDLYIACRTATGNTANILYVNNGDGTFTRVAGAGGAAGPIGMAVGDGVGTADSAVTADYDVDGYLDIFVTNGLNMFPVRTGGPNKLFHNRGGANHWLELDLVGTQSHREAVGTIVKAVASGLTQTRIKNGSYHRWSHDHTRMHFGLAQATTVDLTIQWVSGNVETYRNVAVDKLYRAVEGSGLQPVVLGAALPYPCGLPAAFDATTTEINALNPGLYLGKNCTDGTWMLRAVSGNSASKLTFAGRLASDAAFQNTKARSVDTGDTLDSTTNPKTVEYQFNVQGKDWDGADALPAQGAKTCFQLAPPAGTKVYLGPLARPLSGAQFDLETLQPCGGVAPPPPPTTATCGMPAYDAGATAGIFLWRSCTTNVWQARVSAGGSPTVVSYAGSVDSSAAYTGVSPVGLESDDVLDTSNASAIAYRLNVANASQDGFNFTLPAGAVTCFRPNSPAGFKITVGSSNLAITPPFRLDDLGPCS